MASGLKVAFIILSIAVIISNCQAAGVKNSSNSTSIPKKTVNDEQKYLEGITKDEPDNIDETNDDDGDNESTTTRITTSVGPFNFSFLNPLEGLQNILRPRPVPTVTITNTLVLEVTKRVTKHPICIDIPKGKPSCISYGFGKGVPSDDSDQEFDDSDDEVWSDGYKNEGLYIEPSATLKMSSEQATAMADFEIENSQDSRSGRYLEFNRATPAISNFKSAINEESGEELFQSDNDKVNNNQIAKFFINTQVTRHVTQTMWVTRVQKNTDNRVTATFVPHNCVPSGIHLPHCKKHYRSETPIESSPSNDVKEVEEKDYRSESPIESSPSNDVKEVEEKDYRSESPIQSSPSNDVNEDEEKDNVDSS